MSKKKIVLPSNSQLQSEEINPFLYGISISIEDHVSNMILEKDEDYENHFSEVDRGFYMLSDLPEWNEFVSSCDLKLLYFMDDEWEVIEKIAQATEYMDVSIEELISVVTQERSVVLGYLMLYIEDSDNYIFI